jgi:hypothetical protein
MCLKKTTDPSGFCPTHREAAGIPSFTQATSASELSKEQLVAFFTKHDPERIADVDQTLEAFKGKSSVLCQKMKEKYGESPRDFSQGATATAATAATDAVAPALPDSGSKKDSDNGEKKAGWFG